MNRKHYKATMNKMANNLTDPIQGVTFETYATINAQMAQGTSQGDLLKKYGIENVAWEKASAGWIKRMQEDTSFSLMTEYGKYFMNAGQGQFAETAKEVAQVVGTHQGAKGEEPMSLEQYVEIMCAQGAAAAQGKDVIQVAESYGINAADYGTVGIYWASRMASDMDIANQFSKLQSKYEAQFNSQPKEEDEISF
jgi:hypothetical protein